MGQTELQEAPIREADLGRMMKFAVSLLGLIIIIGSGLGTFSMWVRGVNDKLEVLQKSSDEQKGQIEILNQKLDRIFEREGGVIQQKVHPQAMYKHRMMTESSTEDAQNPDLRR